MNTSKIIYVIDDDEKLCALLQEYLARFSYQIKTFTHPQAGLDALQESQPALLILDVMLPEMDGFEVLKQLRKTQTIPVIMLTARGETMDKIVGLELGADDYLAKPFEPRELVARIETILRRTKFQELQNNSELHYADLLINLQQQTVKQAGQNIDLTTMEYEILILLIKHSEKIFSRNDIMDEIRGIDWNAFNRSIDVSVSRLRQKLNDDPKHPAYIKTIWGRGYQFIGKKIEQND